MWALCCFHLALPCLEPFYPTSHATHKAFKVNLWANLLIFFPFYHYQAAEK